MKTDHRRLGLTLALVFLSALSGPVRAEYPDHIIKGVVPFTPGGATDLYARVIAPYLSKALGQTVVVENKGGAAGNIGMDSVAKSKPDGYTILFNSSAATVNPAMFRKLPFDPIKDLQPVAMLSEAPTVVAVNTAKVPSKTLKEFVDLVKKNPGKFNAAAGGVGTQLPVELFRLQNNLDMVVLLYKGAGDAVTAMVSGEADCMIVTMPPLAPHIAAGRLRALAVAGEKRLPAFPDVPTTREAGMPDFTYGSAFGVYVRAGTPPEIVRKLNATLNAITAMPEVADRVKRFGATPLQKTPEEFTEAYHREIARLKDVVARAKIQTVD